jgi:hypothetical protein
VTDDQRGRGVSQVSYCPYEGHRSNLVERPISSLSRPAGPVPLQVAGVEVTFSGSGLQQWQLRNAAKEKSYLGRT